MSWDDDQKWEAGWWGSCTGGHMLGEEMKQVVYARRMGLRFHHDGKSPWNIDLGGASVLDIGGGPCSLLLKCVNVGRGVVADPCPYPKWVADRYAAAGLLYVQVKGEDLLDEANVTALRPYDLCLIYNCLEHVADPAQICANARALSKVIRIFEWVDTGTSPGHPWNLTEALLDEWLSGAGKAEPIDEADGTCRGRCYHGIFRGEAYGA